MNRKTLRFILAVSTHTALQLPQSPLLPCRRNISFPGNSYPLKRWKFHLIYKNGRGFERRTYQEQIQLAVRVGLPVLWAAGLKVQRSDVLVTLPNNKRHLRESAAHEFQCWSGFRAKSPVRGSQFFFFEVKLVLGSEKIFPYCEVFGWKNYVNVIFCLWFVAEITCLLCFLHTQYWASQSKAS